ncbi:hemocyanin subunit 2-like [Portunus trituberculatus]|uniref:hemocyanin subunit 2-like n=1 Tax=Portunus trituberculatus TaxID=210409 RepID=UPI001E1D1F8F|nr:hemocyanin subunit 2-like [Portunus trituberculatus]
MKLLLLCALVAAAAAWPNFGMMADSPGGASDAQKQHDVNSVLWKVYEEIRDPHLKELSETFDPLSGHYDDDGVSARRLIDELNSHRMLEQKHWFSLFNTKQRQEALMLYDVLEHSTDWDTFAGNAAFFRARMNEGEFVYAIYAAVIHSPLTQHVVLPPLYEVTPHLFTNSEVIQEAYKAKMTQTAAKIQSHFTGSKSNPEQRVAYFGEDIGMNTHHVTWHLEFPFWWDDAHENHHINRKGESFFWVHHQLTVRFDAERLSNYLDPVDELHWDDMIHEGFAPHTMYKYGGYFPSRPDNVNFEDVDGVARVRDMLILESRIRDAIAHGYITGRDGSVISIRDAHGIDILGDVIESSTYSPNTEYYGSLHNTAHVMLGRQGDPHGKFALPPGVLEHFETATRDPAFFRLHKYMDNIFREHKDSLTPYTKEELEFSGVSVNGITFSNRLETHFEDFEYNLINAVDDTAEIPDVPISTVVDRLTHNDFTVTLDISNNNDHEILAVVRAFAWPKYDNNHVEFSFNDGRWNAIEMDKFWVKLASGKNEVKRSSKESAVTVPDVPSFQTLIDKANEALTSGSELHLEEYYSSLGLPNRFLLPKGKTEGMDFHVVVFVSDGAKDAGVDGLHESTTFNHYGCHDGTYPDNQPHGYPLDRRVDDERIITGVSNFKAVDVKVYHVEEDH